MIETLQQRDIKPSYLRLKILEYMLARKNHPTVDMVYEELSKEIPTLSRTTVYNTFNLFLQKGLVQKLGIDDVEAHYDADISLHGHFRCDHCGKIWDLPVKTDVSQIEGLKKFEVRTIEYYAKGLCDQCQKCQRHSNK
ncbi:MAG TPA: transcriptional repressor [Ruminiclostridium sp.]|nr:transcriptional repressor [Ruminiclostridium sp.]